MAIHETVSVPTSTNIFTIDNTGHWCTQNPCPFCQPYITTFTTNSAWCVDCECNMPFPHICKGLELRLLKAEMAILKDESIKQAKLVARYRSLLEEFKAAAEAELE